MNRDTDDRNERPEPSDPQDMSAWAWVAPFAALVIAIIFVLQGVTP